MNKIIYFLKLFIAQYHIQELKRKENWNYAKDKIEPLYTKKLTRLVLTYFQ